MPLHHDEVALKITVNKRPHGRIYLHAPKPESPLVLYGINHQPDEPDQDMNTTKPTMKTKYLQESPRRTATVGLTATVLLFSSLALPTALAKKPGGGGGGDDPVTINPVPILVDAPVTFSTTELRWHEDSDPNFGGITFNGINNQGLVVAFIASPHPEDPHLYGRRTGAINLDLDTGSPTAVMVDLNEVFAAGLQQLNLARLETEEWRIAYGRKINNAGLVACHLIPQSAPRIYGTDTASSLGIEPTPTLLVVADLTRRAGSDSMMIVPTDSASPDQDFLELNEMGDVLVLANDPTTGEYFTQLFQLEFDLITGLPDGYATFDRLSDLGPLTYSNRPSLNSSLEVLFHRNAQSSRNQTVRQLIRYSALDGSETILWETQSLLAGSIACDGSAYATERETIRTGKGKNAVTTVVWTPYHVLSETERTPLVSESASMPFDHLSVSQAAQSGEEEVVIQIETTARYQVYKPNFGARFDLVDLPASDVKFLQISSPVAPSTATEWDHDLGSGTYSGGYIGYGTDMEPDRTFILTPNGAPVPGK